MKKNLFTLIELLVVVAIIGILASILLPSLSNARIRGYEAVCISNLKQSGIASQLYADDNDEIMPFCGKTKTADDPNYAANITPGYWQFLIRDYSSVEAETFWDFKAEGTIFECPLQDIKINSNWTWLRGYSHNFHYMGYNNTTAQFSAPQKISSVPLPDRTIFLADSQDQDEVDLWTRSYRYGYIYPPHQKTFIHKRHRKGIHINWVDGHVRRWNWTVLTAGKNGDASWYWRRDKTD